MNVHANALYLGRCAWAYEHLIFDLIFFVLLIYFCETMLYISTDILWLTLQRVVSSQLRKLSRTSVVVHWQFFGWHEKKRRPLFAILTRFAKEQTLNKRKLTGGFSCKKLLISAMFVRDNRTYNRGPGCYSQCCVNI